jgi:hypothetical protein
MCTISSNYLNFFLAKCRCLHVATTAEARFYRGTFLPIHRIKPLFPVPGCADDPGLLGGDPGAGLWSMPWPPHLLPSASVCTAVVVTLFLAARLLGDVVCSPKQDLSPGEWILASERTELRWLKPKPWGSSGKRSLAWDPPQSPSLFFVKFQALGISCHFHNYIHASLAMWFSKA